MSLNSESPDLLKRTLSAFLEALGYGAELEVPAAERTLTRLATYLIRLTFRKDLTHMAREVRVPKQYLEVYKRLALIPDAAFDKMLKALSKESSTTISRAIEDHVIGALGDKGDDIEVVSAIWNLVDLPTKLDLSVSQVALELSQSFLAQLDAAEQKKHNHKKLQKRLGAIISSCKNITNANKIIDLFEAHANVIRSFRIISDIRIVFGDKLESQNQQAVLIHNLALEYTDSSDLGRRSNTAYFAMDRSDLTDLQEAVKRAIKKDSIIRQSNKGRLTFMEFES